MTSKNQKTLVAERIDRALSAKFGEDFDRLEPGDSLLESGMDSVDMLDALAELEKLFRITFDREELVGIATLGELYEAVCECLVEEHGEGFELS